MVMLFISCIDNQGEYNECMCGGPTLESGLDTVNSLVQNGTKLTCVRLRYYSTSEIQLPLEAFDGQSIGNSFRKLEQEWKLALLN